MPVLQVIIFGKQKHCRHAMHVSIYYLPRQHLFENLFLLKQKWKEETMHKSWNEKPPTFELIGKLMEIETTNITLTKYNMLGGVYLG